MVKKVRSENTTLGTDTHSFKVPMGTTAQRVREGSAEAGQLRYNTSLAALEYYNGSSWVILDVAPEITSISPSTIVEDGSTTTEVTITGSGFNAGTAVSLVSADSANTITPSTVTFVNATTLRFTCSAGQIGTVTGQGADFNTAKTPFSVKVTSAGGKSNTLSSALSINSQIYWITAGGNLTNTFSGNRSVSATVEARDPESSAITYSVTTGSLPAGVSLNANTGAITGTDTNPGSVTTYNFEITATDGTNSNNQYFNIVSYPQTTETFTSSGTFTVPDGLTSVDVLVVAGGGGGGGQCNLGGGGGGGGLIYRPGLPITPGSPIAVTVGGSGSGGWDGSSPSQRGGTSQFAALTAIGGGGGGAFSGGAPGGSGGGGGGNSFQQPTTSGGTGTQPQQPGESGSYGFGNPGGTGAQGNFGPGGGAGGGGAGARGGDFPNGNGGAGRNYSISGSPVDYAGGGGGNNNGSGAAGGGSAAQAGTANRGGGGGCDGQPGGSGIVIVQY